MLGKKFVLCSRLRHNDDDDDDIVGVAVWFLGSEHYLDRKV